MPWECLVRQTRDDKAIADFNRALKIDSDNAYSYNGRGNAWYGKHEYDKAIADYDKALEINPNDAYAYHARGSAWSNKGDYDKCIADATEAIRLNPQYPPRLRQPGLGRREQG